MSLFEDPCYPLISLLLICTIFFLRRVVRNKTHLLLGFAAALQLVTSLLTLSLMLLHTVASLLVRIMQKKCAWVPNERHIVFFGVPYNFRVYSLVLLGVLLSVLGARGIVAAFGRIRPNRRALLEAVQTDLWTAAIAIPAIPCRTLQS